MYSPKSWSVFKLKDLFDIETGIDLIYGDLEDGEYPVIGHCEFNHGITRYTKKLDDYKLYDHTKTISLGDRGTFVAYVQPQDFYIGTRVKALTAKFPEANMYSLMFISTCINLEQYKFCYGRNATNKTPNIEIKLPITPKGKPDWKFMENFIQEKYKKAEAKTTTKIKTKPNSLDTSDWKDFKISDLFDIELSKGDLKIDNCAIGNIPLISSGETNNGCVGLIDSEGDGKAIIFTPNKITVDMFCNAFYQDQPFFAVSHGRVNILSPKFPMNKYMALFITTLINHESFRFAYGRAVYSNVISDLTIKLPTNHKGNPDWQFMENYIKSLPYSDLI